MGIIQAVVGAQYGSEGKGAVGARLGRAYGGGDFLVRVAGPNAGHTAYDSNGVAFAFRQLPVASVVNHHATIVIAAGSEIDPPVLQAEIALAESHGHPIANRLWIDAEATVITDEHKAAESALIGGIGSTGKGIGAARAARLMRQADRWIDYDPGRWAVRTYVGDTAAIMNRTLEMNPGARLMLEGTQGYGLGLHAGHYPQVTSSDCRAIDFLSMAGINPWGHTVEVWLATRVYPIRVAGNSGPLKGETSWSDLGLPEERTTVTRKIRRVGGWDPDLVRKAIAANGPSVAKIALTMLDQYDPAVAGWDGHVDLEAIPEDAQGFIRQVQAETGGTVVLAGTSPSTMIEVAQ